MITRWSFLYCILYDEMLAILCCFLFNVHIFHSLYDVLSFYASFGKFGHQQQNRNGCSISNLISKVHYWITDTSSASQKNFFMLFLIVMFGNLSKLRENCCLQSLKLSINIYRAEKMSIKTFRIMHFTQL